MTSSVRHCLSYDFKMELNQLQNEYYNLKTKRIVDMDVVNDVTCPRQSVIIRVVIRFL